MWDQIQQRQSQDVYHRIHPQDNGKTCGKWIGFPSLKEVW